MAILFSSRIRNLMARCMLFNSTTSTYAVTVYSGVQPAASAITTTWTNYNSLFLVHIQNVVLQCANFAATNPIIDLSSSGSGTAVNSGTAAWAILWPTNPTQASVQGGTIPSTQFVVCDVSTILGLGVIRFNSTTITSALSYSVVDVGITFSGGAS